MHGERSLYDSEWVRLTLVDVELPSGSRFEHHVDPDAGGGRGRRGRGPGPRRGPAAVAAPLHDRHVGVGDPGRADRRRRVAGGRRPARDAGGDGLAPRPAAPPDDVLPAQRHVGRHVPPLRRRRRRARRRPARHRRGRAGRVGAVAGPRRRDPRRPGRRRPVPHRPAVGPRPRRAAPDASPSGCWSHGRPRIRTEDRRQPIELGELVAEVEEAGVAEHGRASGRRTARRPPRRCGRGGATSRRSARPGRWPPRRRG